jgi:hypothetical protein
MSSVGSVDVKLCFLPCSYLVQVNTMTPENVGSCGGFWKASRPKQTKAPARAYRNAIISSLNDAARMAEGGVTYKVEGDIKDVVRTVKIRCSNPPSPAKGKKGKTNLRIRVTAELKDISASDAYNVISIFYQYYYGGEYSRAVADNGAGKYQAIPYQLSGIAPICSPGSFFDSFLGSCPTRWNPNKATIWKTN